MSDALELDPRWDWVDVSTVEEGYGTTFIKGACRHTEVIPVESAGEVVAELCLTCDKHWPLI